MRELDPSQLRAAILVSKGLSPTEVGDEVGVSARTIQRWQKIDLFAQTVENLSRKIREQTLEKTTDSLVEENQIWAERRLLLRSQEWEISQLLLEKVRKALEDLEISGRIQNIANALKIGSELGRVSSELWSSDLNAAISLVRQYGFDVIDVSNKSDDEADESED
jgi:transposase